MSQTLLVVGWTCAASGAVACGIARLRSARLAEVLARTSHELRGPLTAARLELELARRAEQPGLSLISAIELELDRATLALADLEHAREGHRKIQAVERQELVDVAELLTASVEAWQGTATARGVELRLLTSSERPLILGRRLRLAQATGNLIANALEHGGGEVEVGWRVDGGSVRIAVSDNGPGLPAPVADLARRGRSRWPHRSRPAAGSRRGHGLSIATAVATLHGGRLAAAPSEQGAKLVLELPITHRAGLAAAPGWAQPGGDSPPRAG